MGRILNLGLRRYGTLGMEDKTQDNPDLVP